MVGDSVALVIMIPVLRSQAPNGTLNILRIAKYNNTPLVPQYTKMFKKAKSWTGTNRLYAPKDSNATKLSGIQTEERETTFPVDKTQEVNSLIDI
jgi:hypothetical protein